MCIHQSLDETIHSMKLALGHSQNAAIVPTVSERVQSHGPTAAEWERIKPVVRRLYVVDKCRLRDVVEILDQQNGFHATYESHHFSAIVPTLIKEQRAHVQNLIPTLGTHQEVKVRRLRGVSNTTRETQRIWEVLY
jgi:hypothetical protein